MQISVSSKPNFEEEFVMHYREHNQLSLTFLYATDILRCM